MDSRHCRDEERRYFPNWLKGSIRNVVNTNVQGSSDQYNDVENIPIYGGWRSFTNEIHQFFDEAPKFVQNL